MENFDLVEYLPFLIPITIIEFSLFGAALYSILKSETFKWGSKTIWILISLIGIFGPIAYFVFGKEEA